MWEVYEKAWVISWIIIIAVILKQMFVDKDWESTWNKNNCKDVKISLWLIFQFCTLLEKSFVTFLALLMRVSVETLGFSVVCLVIYHSNCVQATWLENSMKRVIFLSDALEGISYEQVILLQERVGLEKMVISQVTSESLGQPPSLGS